MDIRIWVGKNANSNVVLNLILKHTSLRTNFSVNSTVLMDGKKVVENVPVIKLVEVFVNHRKEVLTRKFNAELTKNNRRTHILEGLIGITSKIDAVIKLIREADNREIALQGLISGGYVVSPEQADAVLKITLGNLTKLDTRAMNDEFEKLTKRSACLTDQLASDKKMLKLISKEQLDKVIKVLDDTRITVKESENLLANERYAYSSNLING